MPGTKWYFGISVALIKTSSYFLQYFSKHIFAELNDIWGSIYQSTCHPNHAGEVYVLSTPQVRVGKSNSRHLFSEYNLKKKDT